MADRDKAVVHPLAGGRGYGPNTGITLREHFAGLAMQGLAANANTNASAKSEAVATRAVEFADALIVALEEPKANP